MKEEKKKKKKKSPEYFPSSPCGPLISQAAGQPCAYRALLADSYRQSTVQMMARSESAWLANEEKNSLVLRAN